MLNEYWVQVFLKILLVVAILICTGALMFMGALFLYAIGVI